MIEFSIIKTFFTANICDSMGFQRFPIKTSHLDQGYIFLPIGIYDSLIPISKSSHEISWIIYSRSCYHKCCYTCKLSIITTNNSFIRNQLDVCDFQIMIILVFFQILFIFTPPLTGFLAKRCCSFRIMLSILTALGGFQALGLLAIPPGRDTTPYPKTLNWGISCGRPNNRARFQKVRKRTLDP